MAHVQRHRPRRKGRRRPPPVIRELAGPTAAVSFQCHCHCHCRCCCARSQRVCKTSAVQADVALLLQRSCSFATAAVDVVVRGESAHQAHER